MLVVGTLFGAVVSLTVANFTPANYVSQVTLLMTPAPTASELTLADIEFTQALTPTFAEISTTAPLLQRVIDSTKVDLDSSELERSVTTDTPAGTGLINIAVSSRHPAIAAALANAIAAELVDPDGGPAHQASALRVTLAVVDPALAPKTSDGLGLLPTTGLGAAIGLLTAISMASAVEILSMTPDTRGRRLTRARPGGGPDGGRGTDRRHAALGSESTPG